MKIIFSWVFLAALLVWGCDDNTGSLGESMIPSDDHISVKTNVLDVQTQSILVDSIYLRMKTAYLGKYVDPDFDVFEADFMTQFNCADNMKIDEVPDSLLVRHQAFLYLYYELDGVYGDSLSVNKLSVYELNKNLETESKDYYYSDINPENYYNPAVAPLGSRFYSIKDLTVKDSLWNTYSNYSVRVRFPDEFADKVIKANHEHPEYFADSESFIENIFKGIYVKHEMGEMNLLAFDDMSLMIFTQIYGTDSLGNIYRNPDGTPNMDSTLVKAVATFDATKEVVQANRFRNSDRLKQLASETKHTYLKTPGGIFTEAILPINDVYGGEFLNDTINAVQLSFTAYNDAVAGGVNALPKPERLALVRKKDMYSFFENNELTDNVTSYSTTITNNVYKFSNINNLVIACRNEKLKALADGKMTEAEWEAANPDWNKVVLIPVSVSTSSSEASTSVVDMMHDLSLSSVRLEGGSDGPRLKMYVTYTSVK